MSDDKPVRHLLGLSGGKDSAALAIYMRDKVPEMEYFFADTGAELPETLEFVDLMEDYLGKKITRLNAGRGFDYYLKLNGNFLPTARSRWCTINLKLKPFEEFVGNDPVISYVAIRADEPYRTGYISTKPNIKAIYPFKEDGKVKDDIIKILEESGIGIPKYYDWRSRSGCYFCFYQRKIEWIGLYENHPDLFEKAKEFEDYHRNLGRNHSWSQDEYLEEMLARKDEIKEKFQLINQNKKPKNLVDVVLDEDGDDDGCLVCFK
ncbi:phosphoadenosine phosphosulfate reductase family protein [Methylomonas sp. LL1]|uniref:phosphoadenosine phosphosulfate reductase family protein n=1 Tax=Methylomonas sp. LL1 TaxID=2785785 RepID=UPI0018C446A8|nr:phosphoadenosine phosphosulfate reductase family protein [Methylomonas sp. LL1]QPK64052.1 phosphoadenosine phosphosulfate reductase family protein [Methylomonas sp. LL1]